MRLGRVKALAVAGLVFAPGVTPQDAGPGCVSTYLLTEDFEGSIVVEAHGSKSVTLPVELSADAPAACRRQVFPLSFAGRADRT